MLIELVFILLGYLFGSIPVGYLIGKLGYNIDIRKYGSGNIGMANVMRTCGKRAGISTMLLDMLKGAIPIISARVYYWFGNYKGLGKVGKVDFSDIGILLAFIAFFAILGHSHPIWLKFKGGKSAAVGAGALLGINPLGFLTVLIIWLVVLKITRYTSLSNLVAGLFYPLLFWLFAGDKPFYNSNWTAAVVGLISFLFIVWRHRENISRLIKGIERKIGEKENLTSTVDEEETKNNN